MSKGSDQRKRQVPKEVFDDNWDRIFKKKKKKKQKQSYTRIYDYRTPVYTIIVYMPLQIS